MPREFLITSFNLLTYSPSAVRDEGTVLGRGRGVGGGRVAVGVGDAGGGVDCSRCTDGVAVGVGLGAPQGLTGQLKISVEAVAMTSTVVAAC